jgi:hypothetical protein
MSKLKAAIITMFLGTSTAAMASPTASFSADANFSFGTTSYAPVIRDHRSEPYQAPAYTMPTTRNSSWVALTSEMQLLRGRDVIRPAAGNFAQIRLQAMTGTSYIQTVKVRFLDGTIQDFQLGASLDRRNPALSFDLAGTHRGIDSITVFGSSRGSYQVFAQPQIRNTGWNDGRTWNDDYGRPAQPSWMVLGTVNQIVNAGTPLEFSLGRTAMATSKIMLKSNGGKSRIFDVTVKFMDGSSQLYHLDRYVGDKGTIDLPASPTFTIDLPGNRRVASVVVNGLNATGSSYSVLAL